MEYKLHILSLAGDVQGTFSPKPNPGFGVRNAAWHPTGMFLAVAGWDDKVCASAVTPSLSNFSRSTSSMALLGLSLQRSSCQVRYQLALHYGANRQTGLKLRKVEDFCLMNDYKGHKQSACSAQIRRSQTQSRVQSSLNGIRLARCC